MNHGQFRGSGCSSASPPKHLLQNGSKSIFSAVPRRRSACWRCFLPLLIPLMALSLAGEGGSERTSTVPRAMSAQSLPVPADHPWGWRGALLRTRQALPEVCSPLGAKAAQPWDRDGAGVASAGPAPGAHQSKPTEADLTKHLLSILFNNCFNTKMH